MGDVMQEVSKDDPLLIEWEKYRATEDYKNTRKWALYAEHVDGSLWAAFMHGFIAGQSNDPQPKK